MQTIREGFGNALRKVRMARELTQEDFWEVSGRTYIGALEAGIKLPTLTKVEQLAMTMDVHPLTLIALGYIEEKDDLGILLATMKQQVREIEILSKKQSAETPIRRKK
jgi:transcriptional regulator with XRE-family HTH domain